MVESSILYCTQILDNTVLRRYKLVDSPHHPYYILQKKQLKYQPASTLVTLAYTCEAVSWLFPFKLHWTPWNALKPPWKITMDRHSPWIARLHHHCARTGPSDCGCVFSGSENNSVSWPQESPGSGRGDVSTNCGDGDGRQELVFMVGIWVITVYLST